MDIVMQVLAEPRRQEERARIGDLFDRHQARLHVLARRMTRDSEEARDLVQETFLRAARHAGRLPDEAARAEAWLVRVLVNLCRDRSRRLRVRAAHRAAGAEGATGPETAGDRGPVPGADPERSLLAASAVRAALAALPVRQRAAIVLHEIEDRPVAEIAGLLGVSAVTVRWHLSRARRRLRACLCGSTTEGGER